MAKKELKDKIELTIFWLGLFCITYLIFGFILKSDLTKPIDSSIFYEVLKDSLTITAAFLAPIAALILFSDWREEHRVKSLLNLIEQIKLKTGKIEDNFINYEKKIKKMKVTGNQDFKMFDDSELIIELLLSLSRYYIELDSDKNEIANYRSLIDSFVNISRKANTNLRFIEFLVFTTRKYEVNDDIQDRNYIDFKNQLKRKYVENQPLLEQIIDTYNLIVEEEKKIKKTL
ncbi:hypothetical protein SOI76_12525 [Acinetobacter pittii]|uniref:hypothetical protein n=1 Tax=Acinetobacter pittii TaxID=48296 RepID=UPI000CE41EE0|nr:hypothetical protein [Acinetobacter pittii]MDC4858270.1 hypothetical protein [Acinetobacter baumannii]PPC06792.1 hypothetical protein ApiMCR8900_06805 [Acinetobacter pittii]WPP58259.1 hypothetical protein SOI76_12525 [Acinetobacter pittii]